MRTCVKLVVLALVLGGSGCADTPTLTSPSRPLRDGGAYLGAGFSKGGVGGTGGIYNEPQTISGTTTVNSDSTTITGPTAPDGRGGTIGSGG